MDHACSKRRFLGQIAALAGMTAAGSIANDTHPWDVIVVGAGTAGMPLAIFASRRGARVLLIDDDLVSREVMATVLTMSGYTVHTAADGDASLSLLAAGECMPDVILMDAQMPGVSGTERIAQLRQRTRADADRPDLARAGISGTLDAARTDPAHRCDVMTGGDHGIAYG